MLYLSLTRGFEHLTQNRTAQQHPYTIPKHYNNAYIMTRNLFQKMSLGFGLENFIRQTNEGRSSKLRIVNITDKCLLKVENFNIVLFCPLCYAPNTTKNLTVHVR